MMDQLTLALVKDLLVTEREDALARLMPLVVTFVTDLCLRNNLTRSLCPSLFLFHNLVLLDITGCKLQFLPPDIGGLVNLQDLYASKNELTSLPTTLRHFLKLSRLQLEGNAVPLFSRNFNDHQATQVCIKNVGLFFDGGPKRAVYEFILIAKRVFPWIDRFVIRMISKLVLDSKDSDPELWLNANRASWMSCSVALRSSATLRGERFCCIRVDEEWANLHADDLSLQQAELVKKCGFDDCKLTKIPLSCSKMVNMTELGLWNNVIEELPIECAH